MRKKRFEGQRAQGIGIAQAEGGSQATVNIDHAYYGPVTQFLPPSRSEARNRHQLLARVRSDWITGILERSLHGAALIDLGFQEEPDAVANPWRFVVQESNGSARTLPQGTPITQVYDEAGKELLILGEPGSGKTTLLLQLARYLLDRAELDESHPIPVVFNLSRWAVKRGPLAEWFVDELHARDGYGVPRERAQGWVNEDEILPLLDGLDEVAPEHRAACINFINAYRRDHLLPFVVCSRSNDYAATSTQVNVRRAVTVLPLTDKQVGDYFQEMPSNLKSLASAILRDKELRALMRTPLMLTIFTLAYGSEEAPSLDARLAAEADLERLFALYVQTMLKRRGQLRGCSSDQFCRWLGYLARQMHGHNQTIFSVEDLQPDWLPGSQSSGYNKITRALSKRLQGKSIESSKLHRTDRSGLRPNEGTWLSLKNGLIGTGRLVAISALVTAIAIAGRSPAGSSNSPVYTPVRVPGSLQATQANESDIWGFDEWGNFINHFTVRFLLSRTNALPWNLIAFLNEAVERRLLFKKGGSYIFAHHLLLDYFAGKRMRL